MRWLIVYLLAVAVIWLFVKNTTWRRGLLAAVSVLFAALMIALTLSEQQQAGVNAPTTTDRQLSEVRQSEAMRYGALKPSDIAIASSSLANSEIVSTDPSGREVRRPDPYRWQLTTRISNRSETYTARDVGLRVQLYSCPAFFSTAQADLTLDALRAACSRVGQRTVGLEKIALAPGETHADERVIDFPNQLAASNPRYWIEVQTVTAETGR